MAAQVQGPFRIRQFDEAVAALVGPPNAIVARPPSGGAVSRGEIEAWADQRRTTDSVLVEVYLRMVCHYINTHANRIGPLAPPNAIPDVTWISSESYTWMLDIPSGFIMAAIELRDRGITPAIFQQIQFVFLLMHVGSHWALVAISPVDRTVEILDGNRIVDNWQHRADNIFVKVFQFLEYFLPNAAFAPAAGWRTMHNQAPSQMDHLNCGMYVCYNAMAVATRSELRPGLLLQRRRHAIRARIGAELLSGGFANNLTRRINRHPGNGAKNRNLNSPWVPLDMGLLTPQRRAYRPRGPWTKQILTGACQQINRERGARWMSGHRFWSRTGRTAVNFAADIEQRLDDIYRRVYLP